MQSVAEQVGSYIIYSLAGLYVAVERCCARRHPQYLNAGWEAVNLDNNASAHATEYYELNRVDADVALHSVRKYHRLHSSDRTVVHWLKEAGWGYELEDVFESPAPPWFFIGYLDEHGNTVDCTESLSHLLVVGNFITIRLLHYLQPDSAGKTWVYLNPKTFDQVEFPSEGILIGDAPSESKKDD
jgi:hypothetical protein